MRNLTFVFFLILCFGLSAQNTPQPSILQDIYPSNLFNSNYQNELFRNRFCKVLTGSDTVIWFVDIFGNRALMPMGVSGGGGGSNIYNSNGALTGARVLSGGGLPLSFSGLSSMTIGGDAIQFVSGGNGLTSTGDFADFNNETFRANGTSSFFTFTDKMEIQDGGATKIGAEYNADYGANQRAANRALVDVGNAKILIRDTMNLHIQSGKYTPTITEEKNLATSVTISSCQFTRINDIVNVSGQFTAHPDGFGTDCSFEMSLPIASNFTQIWQCSGVASCGYVQGQSGAIEATITNNTAIFSFVSNSDSERPWSFSFSYQII